jgi:NADH:ubiquinone oxidoreductase subunit
MIPPKWHGWLAHVYDDVPLPDSDSFHDPFFEKPHEWNMTDSAFRTYTSKFSINHPLAIEFKQYRKDRYAK